MVGGSGGGDGGVGGGGGVGNGVGEPLTLADVASAETDWYIDEQRCCARRWLRWALATRMRGDTGAFDRPRQDGQPLW